MADYPASAVKKIKNPTHREIAVGILIAYGLFPRTNEGIANAERLIAGRETWLAPSGLPNYYDDIESDLMTGRETAGIIYIRNALRKFYGLDDNNSSKITLPKVVTGETTVYRPEDKSVDDMMENLDQKLEETSNQIMDAVDALIEKQKKDFEEFKRKQEEERQQRKEGENQYPTPIGPDPIQGPVEPPIQGPKEPPRKTVAPEKDEDWESEVPDQLGTKLDELIDAVRTEPLPKPSGDRRKRTKGKTVKRSKPRYSDMHVGSPLAEVMDNVIEAKNALLDLYQITKKSFEFKKNIDKTLTQRLSSKRRESQLEKPSSPDGEKEKTKDEKKESELQKSLKSSVKKGVITGLVGALAPLFLSLLGPFMQNRDAAESDNVIDDTKPEGTPDESSLAPPEQPIEGQAPPAPILPPPDGEVPPAPVLPPPTGVAPPAPVLPPPVKLQPAAEGRKFERKKSEPLKPLNLPLNKVTKNNEGLSKAIKPLLGAVQLPIKVGAGAMLSFAHAIVNPFAMFMPPPVKSFINNIFKNISDTAGLNGVNFQLSGDSFIDVLKKALQGAFGTNPGNPGTPGPGGPGSSGGALGSPSVSGSEEETLLRLINAEAGGQGKLGMAAVGRSVLNRAGLVQSGNINAGQFNASSGSISDIINAPGQYQPVRQGKLNRALTPQQRAAALEALNLARNPQLMRQQLLALGKSEAEVNKIMAATGFRRFDAGYDASQDVNTSRLGDHQFNTAGNYKMLVPGAQIKPAPKTTPPIGQTPKQQFEQSVNNILGLPNQTPPPSFTLPTFGTTSRSNTADYFTLQPGL
jgi:hypothetical protein